MKKIIPLVFVSAMVTGCIKTDKDYNVRNELFSKELSQLKDYFHIPGRSVIVKKGDKTEYENYTME